MSAADEMRKMAQVCGEQKMLAAFMEISPQYLCDILGGRRRLTPIIVSAFCDAVGEPKSKKRLHRMAAREQGWTI